MKKYCLFLHTITIWIVAMLHCQMQCVHVHVEQTSHSKSHHHHHNHHHSDTHKSDHHKSSTSNSDQHNHQHDSEPTENCVIKLVSLNNIKLYSDLNQSIKLNLDKTLLPKLVENFNETPHVKDTSAYYKISMDPNTDFIYSAPPNAPPVLL